MFTNKLSTAIVDRHKLRDEQDTQRQEVKIWERKVSGITFTLVLRLKLIAKLQMVLRKLLDNQKISQF